MIRLDVKTINHVGARQVFLGQVRRPIRLLAVLSKDGERFMRLVARVPRLQGAGTSRPAGWLVVRAKSLLSIGGRESILAGAGGGGRRGICVVDAATSSTEGVGGRRAGTGGVLTQAYCRRRLWALGVMLVVAALRRRKGGAEVGVRTGFIAGIWCGEGVNEVALGLRGT